LRYVIAIPDKRYVDVLVVAAVFVAQTEQNMPCKIAKNELSKKIA